MTTCGYVCPQCEGKGYTEDLNACDWCTMSNTSPTKDAADIETDTLNQNN